MTTEKKVRQNKKKNVEPKEELVFTESTKEPCETCKEAKELQVKLPKYTKEEMDLAMTMVNKFSLTRQEADWLTNLNNRVLNDKKQSGCGKCLVQVKKNLTNAYQRLYG
jgi:hypothetical protein